MPASSSSASTESFLLFRSSFAAAPSGGRTTMVDVFVAEGGRRNGVRCF